VHLFSYYSVVSDGGTRHVKRKKKNADGTYGDSESYHSEDSMKAGGGLAEKERKKKEKTERPVRQHLDHCGKTHYRCKYHQHVFFADRNVFGAKNMHEIFVWDTTTIKWVFFAPKTLRTYIFKQYK
jgi:hypothetical protein